MKVMAKNVKHGDIATFRGTTEKVTEVRYHGFPRNSQGKSYMLTIQRGFSHTMFNETDLIQIK